MLHPFILDYPMNITIAHQSDHITFDAQGMETEFYPLVSFAISASGNGFSGSDSDIAFPILALRDFITQLTALEKTCQGEAKLLHFLDMSEFCPCRFRLFSLDRLGHIAVQLELLRTTYAGSRPTQVISKIVTTFEIDPGMLPRILADFRQLESLWE